MISSQRRGWSDQPQTGRRDKSFLRIPVAGVQDPHNLLPMPVTVMTNTTQEALWERKDWVCFRLAGSPSWQGRRGDIHRASCDGRHGRPLVTVPTVRKQGEVSVATKYEFSFPLSLSLRPVYGKEPPTCTVSLPPCLLQLSLSGNILTVRPRTTSPGWF